MSSPRWLRVCDALKSEVGTKVTVKGWVRTRRDSKAEGGLSFLNIHDGTCFDPIQVVCPGSLPNYTSEISKLTTHCSVECDGTIVATPKGGKEISADPAQGGAVRVIGWVDDPDHYPIQPKQHTMEFLRENAHLRVRTNTFGAVARIRHTLSMAMHRFYHERGFFYVHTPIITASDCEGAGQMFRVSTLDMVGRHSMPTTTPATPSSSNQPAPSPPLTERLTERARKALAVAKLEAERLKHTQLSSEHVLIALISDEQAMSRRALTHKGIDLDKVRLDAERAIQPGTVWKKSELITLAVAEATSLGHNYLGTEHLLLGLLRLQGTGACQILAQFGVTHEVAKAQVVNLLRDLPARYYGPVSAPADNRPAASPAQSPDFSRDFFGKEAHLTVSGQLNVETYCTALSRVYTFGPTFRAENSNTSRHLAEFWMIEPEIAFADLQADSELAEDFIKYLINACLTERADDMKFFDERIEKGLLQRLDHVLKAPFRRLPYTEAIKILEKAIAGGKKFEYPVKWGTDLQSEHERYLTEEHFKQPVILMNYPKQIKAFYMRLNAPGTDNAPGDTVAAMDVLVPGVGEIIGGSQREERLDVLDARINEMNLPIKEYWWYRDLRRYGTVPHAGFGLGFERAMMFITGMGNVRDVIPFPRTPGSAEF